MTLTQTVGPRKPGSDVQSVWIDPDLLDFDASGVPACETAAEKLGWFIFLGKWVLSPDD